MIGKRLLSEPSSLQLRSFFWKIQMSETVSHISLLFESDQTKVELKTNKWGYISVPAISEQEKNERVTEDIYTMDPRGHHSSGAGADHHPPHGGHGGGRAHGHQGAAAAAGGQQLMLPRLVGGLRCLDVMREMEEQLVTLTGGRDRRGASLLSFHQNPRRERAKPEEYKKLLDYLLGVPW